ncbi:MAG TPA: DUF4397 domain-containing protein [Gammaproteobacteria bacterium]|nr:DUF4397 domain-containing protein [Gammaproteobacteria bacterium]
MNLRQLASCGLVCALALVGCDEGRPTPPRVTVGIVNAAPGFAELGFRREQTQPLPLVFKSAQEVSYDADAYDFYVEGRIADGTFDTWSFTRTLVGDTRYVFVLTEVAGDVVPVVLEHGAAPSADAQILAAHGGGGVPALDLYLERPGVGIGGATPRGTLAAQGQLAARTVPSGDYELFFTAAGDPATVLFTSPTITLTPGTTTTFVVTPEAGETTAPFSVQFVQALSDVLFDRNATTELRVINAATDRQPRDFAINREFAPPLFPAVPFASPTSHAAVPASSALPINVTPPGNPGVLELDQTVAIFAALRYTILFTGDAGTLTHVLAIDDNRRIYGTAKLRFINAALQFTDSVELVLVTPGELPEGILGQVALLAPSASVHSPLVPGTYDLYLRRAGTNEILSGPTPVTLDERGIYAVLAVNGPDSTTAEVVLLDDFP